VRVIGITGKGDTFCAGADLSPPRKRADNAASGEKLCEKSKTQAPRHGPLIRPAPASLQCHRLTHLHGSWRAPPLCDGFDYEPAANDSLGARASRTGKDIDDVLYEYLIEDGGTGFAAILSANYLEGNLDVVREMLAHPDTVTGLGDAGAHVNLICDGSMPTTQLLHWAGGRTRGEGLPI
jgi:hypothetical protein